MFSRSLSIEDQLASMKTAWPLFVSRRVDRRRRAACWIGPVRPQYARYVLEICYRLGKFPAVRVLSPPLVRLPGNDEGELPHVYPPSHDPTLCLFDPRARQWSSDMPIAETTVPWSLDWLVCYEHWLMTGEWVGGGCHASLSPSTSEAS